MTDKNSKEILIAEDDRSIAKALQLKLEHSGFTVKVVFDGEEAIAAVNQGDFALVLLDLMMPKKDGFDFLEAIKGHKKKPAIIILSNLSQESDVHRALELGAADFLVKSDTPLLEVVAKVNKILGL